MLGDCESCALLSSKLLFHVISMLIFIAVHFNRVNLFVGDNRIVCSLNFMFWGFLTLIDRNPPTITQQTKKENTLTCCLTLFSCVGVLLLSCCLLTDMHALLLLEAHQQLELLWKPCGLEHVNNI